MMMLRRFGLPLLVAVAQLGAALAGGDRVLARGEVDVALGGAQPAWGSRFEAHVPVADGALLPPAHHGRALQAFCSANNMWTWTFNGTAGLTSAITPGVGAFGATNLCADAYGRNVTMGASKSGRVVAIDLGVIPPDDSVLYVDTCQSTPTNVGTNLYVGRGCPTSWSPFSCIVATNDTTGGACPGRSQVWAQLGDAVTQSIFYVYVTVPSSASTASIRLAWQLLVPPGQGSETPTSSNTPSPSVTPSVTPSAWCDSTVWNASRTLYGTSGRFNASTANTSLAIPHGLSGECANTGQVIPGWDPDGGQANIFAIDLGVAPPQWPAPANLLVVDTCGYITPDWDSMLFVGTGCAVSADSFTCIAANDDAEGPLPDGETCVSLASRISVPIRQQVLYVMVVARGAANNGNYSLRWRYQSASITPTSSVSSSWSSSRTPTRSDSSSRTPTASSTASLTRGAAVSGTPTGTPSNPSTPAVTVTNTATVSATRSSSYSNTASLTASGSNTPPTTPTRTPTASGSPYCTAPRITFNGAMSGVQGSYSGSTEGSGNAIFVTPTQGGYNSSWVGCEDSWSPGDMRDMPSGNKHILTLDLGAGTVLGGTLLVDTCNFDTPFDTVLFVGAGCADTARNFRCVSANDDACGSQSRVLVPVVDQRFYYVIIAGFRGSFGPYRISWDYDLPSPSNTPSISVSGTVSPRPTGTRAPGSRASQTASNSPPATATVTASLSATASPSTTVTPRGTPSNSGTPGLCGMGASNAYLTARLSGLSGVFTGQLDGQAPLFHYGSCPLGDGTTNYGLIKDAPQVFVAVDIGGLGEDVPSSGFLLFDTCNGTDFDTILFVGTGA